MKCDRCSKELELTGVYSSVDIVSGRKEYSCPEHGLREVSQWYLPYIPLELKSKP